MLEPRALREPTAAAVAAEGVTAGMAAASAVPAGAGMAEKKKAGNGRKGRKGKGPGKKPAPQEEGEAPGSTTGKPVGRCGGRPTRTFRALSAAAGPHAAGTSPAEPPRPAAAARRAPGAAEAAALPGAPRLSDRGSVCCPISLPLAPKF